MNSWHKYPLVSRRIMLTRGLRSIGQGVMVVDFTLYLRALHWSSTQIGLLLTAAGLSGAILALSVGIISDKIGRKPFLIIYETITALAAFLATFSANGYFLGTATIVSSFGRGQGGGAGPFAPAEQAWLATSVPARQRGPLFSMNNAIGFLGMGIGAAMAGTVHFFHPFLPGALAYRPLFAWVGITSIINLYLIVKISLPPESEPEPIHSETATRAIVRAENKAMLKLALINAMNGMAMGLTGPLMAYWFAVRFGVGPGMIGGMLALSFFLTTLSSLVTGRATARFGMVRSVVWIRLIGVILLVLMPLMPTFTLASVVFLLRSAMNRGSQGARQAVAVSLTRDSRRGLATSLNAISMRLPASVGPSFSGYLMGLGNLDAPFYVGAVFQIGYAVLYGWAFRDYDQKQPKQTIASSKSI